MLALFAKGVKQKKREVLMQSHKVLENMEYKIQLCFPNVKNSIRIERNEEETRLTKWFMYNA